MTIAPPARTISATPPPQRPGASGAAQGGGGGGGGGVTLDPVRLVRQHKFLLVTAAVFGGAVGAAAYWVTNRYVPSYVAKVTYQSLPPEGDPVKGSDIRIDPQELDRFTSTQVRIMTAERILREAVRDPKLKDTSWIRAYQTDGGAINQVEAVKDLKDGVSARAVQGTSLIELSVSARTPADSSTLATAVHEAFWRDFNVQTNNLSRERRDALNKRQADIKSEISRLTTSQASLLDKAQLTSLTEAGSAEDNEIKVLQPKLAELKASLQRLETDKLRMEQQLRSETGIQYGDDIREEVEREGSLVSAKNEIDQLKATRDAKRQKLGDSHREITQLQSLIDAKESAVNDMREKSLRKAFEGQIERLRQNVEGVKVTTDKTDQDLQRATRRKEDTVRMVANYIDSEKQLETLRIQEVDVKTALASLQALENMSSTDRIGRMRILERARVPDAAAFPRLPIMLAAGFIFVFGGTASLLVLREILDQRIKNPSDISLIPRMRMLGYVPFAADDPAKPVAAETAFRECPGGAIAESFRQLRPSLMKRMQQAGHRSLLLVGTMPGSGTSTVAANLATAVASADMRVLLIDANFRRPALHKIFKLGEGPGLGNVLARTTTLEGAWQATGVPGLTLLSAGTIQVRSTPERLASDAMTQVIREAGEKFDLVILDTAPAMVAGDGLALANRCDCTALVVRALAEKRGLVARIRDQLSDTRAEFLGVIVNAVRANAGGYLRGNIRTSFEYQTNGAIPAPQTKEPALVAAGSGSSSGTSASSPHA